jgi:DNA invertase Pin-like site-specific DNA recombinase
LARAKAQGKKLGRPQVSKEKAEAIRQARATGMGERRIARELRVGVGTVRRLAQQARAEV